MMQPFPDAERALRAAVAATPVLVLNESGKREKQSGQFLARSITRSVRQSVVRPSVRPFRRALSPYLISISVAARRRRKRERPSVRRRQARARGASARSDDEFAQMGTFRPHPFN